ncbi:MAG: hypothetical protein KDE63_13680, partial [Novosphingobium sp.]|nr:hypothetical protein [Novosphingobium sp.]
WRVANDVARRYVSVDAARREYGVVLTNGEVNEAETEALRAKAARHTGHFHFGPERDEYETQWNDAAYDALTALLATLPIHWRFFVKTEIFRRMPGRTGADGVQKAFEETCVRFPDVPHAATPAIAAE